MILDEIGGGALRAVDQNERKDLEVGTDNAFFGANTDKSVLQGGPQEITLSVRHFCTLTGVAMTTICQT